MMEQDYNIKHWTEPCHKVDCRKSSCKCGIEKVFIPTALGDDSKGSPAAPANGAYCNALVVYEANGHMYIYSKDGIPTRLSSGGGGDYNEIIEKIQDDLSETERNLSQETINRVAADNSMQLEINAKQNTLVSGTNIKTINNQSILGSGNITIEGGSGGELSDEVKRAILDCFENVAWTTADGRQYYDTLEELFFPSRTLASISAVFDQGSAVVYPTDSLDSLKQYLTVTATYDDSTTETLDDSDYTLSGTLSVGTSTVTVTYEGKTDTFQVTVSQPVELSSISAVYTQSGTVYPTDSLDSLKSDLVVTAHYTDSSTQTVNASDYTLSGTLAVGTSTITVTYSGKTTTFQVTVSQPVELSSISAVYTQSGTVYTTDSLDSLKTDLVVTAHYTDSSTRTISVGDYTLSGTLTAGTSTITVTYEGKTTTFSVTVTAVVVSAIDAVFTQGDNKVYEDTALNDLKQYLTVTATYNNGTTATLSANDYTLSGTLAEGTSTITVTYEGLTDTFTVTVTALVPSGYTMVDYITSAVHGTPAAAHLPTTPYIKTNFPATDTDIIDYSFELDFMPLFDAVAFCPIGGRNGTNYSNSTRGTIITGNNSTDNFIFGNNSSQTSCLLTYLDDSISANRRTKFRYDAKSIYIDDAFKATVEATSAVQLSSYKWALFARNNNGDYSVTTTGGQLSPMIGKVYSFTIKDANGNYVLRYVPCKRNSDDVYGMYDAVSSTFFTSAISTAFSGGNE